MHLNARRLNRFITAFSVLALTAVLVGGCGTTDGGVGGLAGTAFSDTNNSGSRDSGEIGLSALTVQLTCGTEAARTTTTDLQGDYHFTFTAAERAAASCTVTVTNPPPGTTATPTVLNPNDGTDTVLGIRTNANIAIR